MDDRNTHHRRPDSRRRTNNRDYIDGRPSSYRTRPDRQPGTTPEAQQPPRGRSRSAAPSTRPSTRTPGREASYSRTRRAASSDQARHPHTARHTGASERYEQHTDAPQQRAARPHRDARQSPQANQPSWYDPERARGSRTPRATLDASLDNPRWYSNGANDVYVGRHRQQRQHSKLPFFIGGGVIALILLIFIISSIVNALAAPPQPQEDPLEVTDTAQTSTSFTISFAGDCTLGTDSSFDQSTSFDAKYDAVGDPSYFMANVADIFAADDYTVVNMEGTLTESNERQDKTFAFKGPAEYTNVLTSGNIEAASLANNHSHDYGDQSYEDTIAALDSAGIANFGYDRIAYADVKGVKVALIGTYELAEGIGIKDEMVSNINTARDQGAQVVIVFTHWGNEKETVPDSTQVELGHAAIDAGADLVVGSHPHVIQGYEKYNGRYIVYSLGNFCFGGNKNPSDKDCMIFQQTFTVTGNEVASDDAINVIPCSISSVSSSNNYQPTPAEGDEKDRILAKIEESNTGIASVSAEVSGNAGSNSSSNDQEA